MWMTSTPSSKGADHKPKYILPQFTLGVNEFIRVTHLAGGMSYWAGAGVSHPPKAATLESLHHTWMVASLSPHRWSLLPLVFPSLYTSYGQLRQPCIQWLEGTAIYSGWGFHDLLTLLGENVNSSVMMGSQVLISRRWWQFGSEDTTLQHSL